MRLPILLIVLFTKNSLTIPLKEHAYTEVSTYDSTDEEKYRLNQTIEDIKYVVRLDLSEGIFDGSGKEFNGKVEITFTSKESLSEIKLHASNQYINISSISSSQIEVSFEKSIIDDADIITLNKTVNENEVVTLDIEYKGDVSTEDMYGIYRSSYRREADDVFLVTTQFQPTHARRAFPCFDEPQYKATFDISVTYPSGKNLTALGNSPGAVTDENAETKKTTFETTQKMSTYLVALIVSDFTWSRNDTGDNLYAVWSREETRNARNLALESGPALLKKLDEFTNISYYGMHQSIKMDQVAIPDFAAGAMENWGLVTYRETALLWDENESSNRYKQRVATVIAHEFAHMWFGNLVTMNWWSETFLNEGFARYFEYHSTDEVYNDWELKKQFVVEQHQTALKVDATITSAALQSSVNSPSEISGRFATISYNKGGSIFRMVEHILGSDEFKKGLQTYLKNNAESTTLPTDLWDAFAVSSNLPENKSLKEVMEAWVVQAGHPVVNVTSTDDTVVLTQQRDLIPLSNSTSQWYIPISYTLSSNKSDFTVTIPKVWLVPDNPTSIEFNTTENDWIIFNNQEAGFYRVHYDNDLRERIASALTKPDFDGIDVISRTQIIDDSFNLARVGWITYPQLFSLISFLKNETEYYPWYPAFAEFDYLLQRTVNNAAISSLLSKNILDLMGKLYASVPVTNIDDSNQIYSHKQVLALTWACKLGLADCIQFSKDEFKKYIESSQRPNPNIRSIVYCNGLRNSDNITGDWEFLFNTYESATATEQVTLLSALGCTTDEETLIKYLNESITGSSRVKKQDALYIFQAVINGGGLNVTFQFLKTNHKEIANHYKGMNALASLMSYIAARVTTSDQITELEEFIETPDLDADLKTAAQNIRGTAQANVDWTTNYIKSLEEALKTDSGDGDGAAAVTFSLATVFLGVICFIFN